MPLTLLLGTRVSAAAAFTVAAMNVSRGGRSWWCCCCCCAGGDLCTTSGAKTAVHADGHSSTHAGEGGPANLDITILHNTYHCTTAVFFIIL